jgi:hypothetical protein
MIPSIESDERQLVFTWTCVNFTNTYMDFLLNYTQYNNVSIHDDPDILQVRFNGLKYFKSPDGQFFASTFLIKEKKVPP